MIEFSLSDEDLLPLPGTIAIRETKPFDPATVKIAQAIGKAVRGANFVQPADPETERKA